MYINNEQFKRVVKRAFVHGLILSGIFENYLTGEEQQEKISEVIEDCKRHLLGASTRPSGTKADDAMR